jgi:hypothetical protein
MDVLESSFGQSSLHHKGKITIYTFCRIWDVLGISVFLQKKIVTQRGKLFSAGYRILKLAKDTNLIGDEYL